MSLIRPRGSPSRRPDLAGGVTVAHQVIAKLAGKAARATYGVVAMQERPIRRLARFFRGSLTEGVEVDVEGDVASIGLHVVMERGVNLVPGHRQSASSRCATRSARSAACRSARSACASRISRIERPARRHRRHRRRARRHRG